MKIDELMLTECGRNENRYQLVIAASKRAKAINTMARQKGILPSQVTSLQVNFSKPTTIALAEIKTCQIVYHNVENFEPEQNE